MITSDAFKRRQSQTRLDQVHGEENYYWYLHCEETKRKALEPLGKIIQKLGGSCLDIGCGEGWLSQFVGDINYTGIDASDEAIRKARQTNLSCRKFDAARFERYPDEVNEQFDTLIFGNMLWLLVKPAYYTSVLKHYVNRFNASYFIIYDLQRLATRDIDNQFKCIEALAVELNLPSIPDVKRHRQIKVYQCE